jgi:pterin-4a-carbinolamine dehydratase
MNYLEFVPNAIGLVGVSHLIFAYFQLQTHRWKADAPIYTLTNLLGALLILISLFFNWNLSSFVIEMIWISISCYRLFFLGIDAWKSRRQKTSSLEQIDLLGADRQNYLRSLSAEERHTLLRELGNGWDLVEGKYLKKTWLFDSFQKSIDFVNQVSRISEKANHHPVFLIEYKKITLTLWTHNIDALTKADYVLAAQLSHS